MVSGRLCDATWVNPIFIFQLGVFVVGLATVLLPLLKSYEGIIVFVVVYGFGDGIVITTMNSLLMFTVDEKRRGAALGLGNSLLALGIAAGPPLAGKHA